MGRLIKNPNAQFAPGPRSDLLAQIALAPVVAAPATSARQGADDRIRLDGKFFRCGESKWFVKGLTYGPFAPDAHGVYLPARPRVRADFEDIRSLGGNAIRIYHTPP